MFSLSFRFHFTDHVNDAHHFHKTAIYSWIHFVTTIKWTNAMLHWYLWVCLDHRIHHDNGCSARVQAAVVHHGHRAAMSSVTKVHRLPVTSAAVNTVQIVCAPHHCPHPMKESSWITTMKHHANVEWVQHIFIGFCLTVFSHFTFVVQFDGSAHALSANRIVHLHLLTLACVN